MTVSLPHSGQSAFPGLAYLTGITTGELKVQRLKAGNEAMALSFLAERPSHTAYLAGMIEANGLESSLNRGDFYGCQNGDNALEGIMLVGHAVVFEARNLKALTALAESSMGCPAPALIRGEHGQVERFWSYYARKGYTTRTASMEHLLELRTAAELPDEPTELRLARARELTDVLGINSQMARDESGVNPAEIDPDGFRRRTLRRIQLGQVWVWVREGRIIFKTEVITQTPQAVYLEGVYVHPDERGKGHGLRLIRRIGNILLETSRAVCLFVNEDNHAGRALYKKAGFQPIGLYRTFYLQRKSA